MGFDLLRYIDRFVIGWILRGIWWIRRNHSVPKKPRKILIIRLWALGSSLLTFPLIEELREMYPEAEFHLLATNRNMGIFQNQWYFNSIFNLFSLLDLFRLLLSFNRYDIIVDTEEYFRISALIAYWCWKISIGYSNLKNRAAGYTYQIPYDDTIHSVLASMRLLEPLSHSSSHRVSQLPKLKYKPVHGKKSDELLRSFKERNPKIIIHAGWAETSPERFWKVENWARLIELIVSEFPNSIVFLSWTAFERKINEAILELIPQEIQYHVVDLSGKTNVFELAAFMEGCDLMISNDTGPMHLSACMDIPTIWLFWPNLPERFWPYPPEKHRTLYAWDGVPSINVHLGEFKKCDPGMMDRIRVEVVMPEIQKLLSKKYPKIKD